MYCGTHLTRSELCSLVERCSRLVRIARSWRAAKSMTFDTKLCDRLFSSATPWICIRVNVCKSIGLSDIVLRLLPARLLYVTTIVIMECVLRVELSIPCSAQPFSRLFSTTQ